jgi:hypothetical protein
VDNRFHSSCVTMFDDRFFRGDFLKIRSQSSIVTRLTKKKRKVLVLACDLQICSSTLKLG